MNSTLSTDSRGVLIPCNHCGATNRIPYSRLGQSGRCGTCKATLLLPGFPIEVEDDASFTALTTQSPPPVLIDFWAPWCGPCRMMAPEFAKASAMSVGQAVFAKVNSDALPVTAAQCRVQGIPAFLLFQHGREVSRTAGFQPAVQLLQWLQASLK